MLHSILGMWPIDCVSLQIRNKLFDSYNNATGYGVTVGQAADAISSLRANISSAASTTNPPNPADEGLMTFNGTSFVQTIVPSGPYNIAFSRTPAEILAIVYLGSASTPGGFFPNGINGAAQV